MQIEVIGSDRATGLVVVTLPVSADADGYQLAAQRPRPSDTVVVGAAQPKVVSLLELAYLDVEEATPVLDADGELVGLCTGSYDGTTLMTVDTMPGDDAAATPAPRPRSRRPRRTTIPDDTTVDSTSPDSSSPESSVEASTTVDSTTPDSTQSPTSDATTEDSRGFVYPPGPVATTPTANEGERPAGQAHRRHHHRGERELLPSLRRDHRPPAGLGALDVRLLVGHRRAPAVGLQPVVGDEPRGAGVAAQTGRDRSSLEPPTELAEDLVDPIGQPDARP